VQCTQNQDFSYCHKVFREREYKFYGNSQSQSLLVHIVGPTGRLNGSVGISAIQPQ
jgi:hypothetical protein